MTPRVMTESSLPSVDDVVAIRGLSESQPHKNVVEIEQTMKNGENAIEVETKTEGDQARPVEKKKRSSRATLLKVFEGDSSSSDLSSELSDVNHNYGKYQRIVTRKGKRRSKQAATYSLMIEERLATLEAELRKRNNVSPPGSDNEDEDTKSPTFPPHHTEIAHHVTRDFYHMDKRTIKHGPHVPEVSMKPRHVIEVLTDDPRFGLFRPQSTPGGGSLQVAGANSGRNVVRDWVTTPTRASVSMQNSPSETVRVSCVPERIRIRSPTLLAVLEKITGLDLVGASWFKHKLVMRRPYKVFAEYGDQILDYYDYLEKKHSGETTTEQVNVKTTDPADGNISSDQQAKQCNVMNNIGSARTNTERNGAEENEDTGNADLESIEALRHLGLLKRLFNEDLKPMFELREAFRTRELKEILHGDLWHIFRPGVDIKASNRENGQVYRVVKVTGGRDLNDPRREAPDDFSTDLVSKRDRVPGSFVVECYSLGFDNDQYGAIHQAFVIRRFEGKRNIASLPVYPITCDPNYERLLDELTKRGERFAHYASSKERLHMKYVGLTLDEDPEHVDSQVIVDYGSALLANRDWTPDLGFGAFAEPDYREHTIAKDNLKSCRAERKGCCGNDVIYDDGAIDLRLHETFMDDHRHTLEHFDGFGENNKRDLILLPCMIPGFVLRSRSWAQLHVSDKYLIPVTYEQEGDGWNELVIKREFKNEILALVKHHAAGINRKRTNTNGAIAMDLVRGKGTGIIILLHGEPGVGKTSTAECLAFKEKRPLYPIVCGDLGGTASKVEDNLETHFQRAHKWGCVLLLDEADVFLQERHKIDLQQNAIVSVFLRALEYYSGILFLTTNRPGAIDPAFTSRIHLALRYEKLSEAFSLQIWTNLLATVEKRFQEDGQAVEIDKPEILEFAKEHYRGREQKKELGVWNGRQIRNAFQTAVALAEYFNPPTNDGALVIGKAHFEEVAKVSNNFENYLREVYKNETPEERAARKQDR